MAIDITKARKTPVAEDDPRLVFLPYADGIVPSIKWNYLEQLTNRWWVIHPKTKAFLFWDLNGGRKSFGGQQIKKANIELASPQCNASQDAVKSIVERMYPWATIEWYERVFRPINPRDWCD